MLLSREKLPNTACTRLMGVCAFSSRLRGLKLVPVKHVLSSRPPAGNASRWAANWQSLRCWTASARGEQVGSEVNFGG
jgi:hypothetical protein